MHVHYAVAADGKSAEIRAGSHSDHVVVAVVSKQDGNLVADLRAMPATVDLAKYVEALAQAGEILA